MKKNKIQSTIDIIILLWILIWLYYLVFNWDVFIVKLNTDFGFGTITLYPFIFFFFLGSTGFIILKYVIHILQIQNNAKEKENKNKITLLEKDIEILKLKEVLFKMQSEGLNKSASTINALQEKIDSLSKKIEDEKEEGNKDEKMEG